MIIKIVDPHEVYVLIDPSMNKFIDGTLDLHTWTTVIKKIIREQFVDHKRIHCRLGLRYRYNTINNNILYCVSIVIIYFYIY